MFWISLGKYNHQCQYKDDYTAHNREEIPKIRFGGVFCQKYGRAEGTDGIRSKNRKDTNTIDETNLSRRKPSNSKLVRSIKHVSKSETGDKSANDHKVKVIIDKESHQKSNDHKSFP